MNKIKFYARFLEFLCLFVCIPLIVGSFLFKWFCTVVPINILNSIKNFYCVSLQPPLPSSLLIVFLAVLVDAFGVALLVWGCVCFIKLLGYYHKGELFSVNTLALYVKMSRIAFAWTLYNPLKFALLSILTTINNPVGQRVFAINFSSDDIFHIFIVGIFLVITSLMQEAYKLKSEHDLTV